MSKKMETVWSASPHTLAKIAILRSYLEKWFSILGTSLSFKGKDLWYIDGFAGPGEYENGQDGSPIAAAKAAIKTMSATADRWKARDIYCLFVEENSARFSNLKRCVDRVKLPPNVHSIPINATFIDGLAKLKQQDVNPFASGAPIFAFIDPFGATGMPFETVRALLSRPTAEVLINLDSDGINRIFSAGTHAGHERILTEVFGDDSWRSLTDIARASERMRAILSLYKSKLSQIRGVKYVFSFEMRSKNNSIDYHLVFASQHCLGLKKMKESMKQIDQDGSYGFCDENVGQGRLFNFDNPRDHAKMMREHFRGQTISYERVDDYALNESPFVNAKAMLRLLESDGSIDVRANGGNRRKGTYPERLRIEIFFREDV